METTDHGGTRDPSFSLQETATDAGEPAIRVRDLSKSFGAKAVLQGFSLDVRRSEMLAIVGGSGSGKSVFLKHLAGLLRPDRGTILLDGIDLVAAGKEEIAAVHRKIGYLFQEGGLLNSLTVYDNVALPLREPPSRRPGGRRSGEPRRSPGGGGPARLPEEEIRTRVTECLTQVGVAEAASKFPKELSGGMRKRAGLARAIIEERSFFFFDEPTSALDPVTSVSIRALIRKVHEQWKSTSLVVTHDLKLVEKVADRVAFLHEGKVRQAGTFEELSRSEDPVVREFFTADHESPE